MAPLIQKSFYMMRHGQTTDNAAGFISGGGRDPDLTALGIEQAERARTAFQKLNPAPSRIIVSALKRTHETAAIVTGGIAQIIDARLNERYLGELDGTITEQEQKERGVLPGEESAQDQAARVIESVNDHLKKPGTALFVCHGGTLRRILEAADLAGKVPINNAEIYQMVPHNGTWSVAEILPTP